MNYSLKSERSDSPGRQRKVMSWLRRLAVVAAIIVAAHLDLRTWNSFVDWIFDRADAAESLRMVGAPIVVQRDDEVTVYLVSARRQMRRATRWWLRRLSSQSELQVDLWAFDGASAQPRWHRRVLTEREGSIADLAVLGIDGDTVWLYAQGLRAHSANDGAAIADAAAIQSRNPQLAGKLVANPRYYGLDRAGLYLTDADARQWRIDANDFSAAPVGTVAAMPRPEIAAPAQFLPASPTSFSARGLDLGDNWLGLLSAVEAAKLSAPPVVPGQKPGEGRRAMAEYVAGIHTVNYLPPLHAEQRYRLWRVRVDQVSAAPLDWPKGFPDNWGTRPVYSNYQPLPEAPEFLGAGLLDRDQGKAAVWLTDPDSVLVLHRDRLGIDGRLQLSRVAGPGGRVVWTTALPLSLLQSSVVAGERATLFGREFLPADPKVAGDPYHDAHERLATVDLRSGQLSTFNVTVDAPVVLDAATEAAR